MIKVGAGESKIIFKDSDFPLKNFVREHDPLFVKTMIVRANIDFVLVSIDMTSLPDSAIVHFKELIIQKTAIHDIYISVTHSFSSFHIPPRIKNEDDKILSDKVYKAMDFALMNSLDISLNSICECDVTYSTGYCDINVNRNIKTNEGYWIGQNPDGFSDHEVRIASFLNKQCFAQIINYDLQSSVMDKVKIDGVLQLSSDVCGRTSQLLRDIGIISFFLPGSAGNQAPYFDLNQDLSRNGYAIVDDLGTKLFNSLNVGKEIEMNTDVQIYKSKAILPEQKMQYPTKELKPHKDFNFELTGKNIEVNVDCLKIGSINLVMTGPELNSEFGHLIRQTLGKKTMLATLVNGAYKYLPQKNDFEQITYTAMNTMLGMGSEDIFMNAISEMEKAI